MAARSGELATRPLPAVLLDLHEGFATGRLVLKRGRVTKSVDLVNGNPVSAASSTREDTLGHFLVGTGVITEEQHGMAVARAAQLGGKVGEALVALQILSMQQLFEQLGKQARHKLVAALRWPQGAWRFEDSNEAVEGMQLRMVEVVLTGLKETGVENVERLGKLDDLRFELTQRGVRLRHELKRVFGDLAVALLADSSHIAEIERAFPDRIQARMAIDSLILADCVEAVVEQVGLGSIPPEAPIEDAPTHRPPSREPARPLAPASALFDILFEEESVAIDGSAPLEFPESDPDAPIVVRDDDSGVVSLGELETASHERERESTAREMLLVEHQRVQGADHYAVLMIGRKASAQDIDAACTIRNAIVDQQSNILREPRDRIRVDEIKTAYATARSVLLDERKRAAYDRELAGGELVQVPPALDTELAFRIAEELMHKKEWSQAIGHLKKVLARSPAEADYHAALGWAEWMAGGEVAAAADVARPHLNSALEINPDHAAAHDYKGRIDAKLQSDDAEALFHLERALDLDPTRSEAVAEIETLLFARGELRRYERVLKRLLFRMRGRGIPAEARSWARLSRLYYDHLDDPAAANAAAANARRIAPKDPEVEATLRRSEIRTFSQEPLRAGWREALEDPSSGSALVRSTEASGHTDAAFLAAATMVALGTADEAMTKLYESQRVIGSALPAKPLGRDQWGLLRHKDDGIELGGLMELVAPAVHVVAPMTLAESDLDPSQAIEDVDLPTTFLRLRVRCAGLLGVKVAPVFSRADLGSQIHVLATEPPVLIAGDEALTAPERPELVFRLVRAMTFLWPGRAVGASRPGRVLRAVVMAVFREASGAAEPGTDDPLVAKAAEAVAQLPLDTRIQARAAALRILSRNSGLNLSLWARSLSRTADRAALLLCGDIPAAFAGAREVGDLDRDLVEFAYSAAHVQLRRQLGLSSENPEKSAL